MADPRPYSSPSSLATGVREDTEVSSRGGSQEIPAREWAWLGLLVLYELCLPGVLSRGSILTPLLRPAGEGPLLAQRFPERMTMSRWAGVAQSPILSFL